MADLQYLIRNAIKKITVMCNHDHNSLKAVKIIFKPGRHLIIQMVGRLIKDQHIGGIYKHGSQRYTFFLSAGKMCDLFFVLLDSQFIQDHMCFCLRIPALFSLTLCHIGKNRSPFRESRMLGKKTDTQAILHDHLTVICFFQSCKDPQKCCLSCSVDSDDSYLVSLMNPTGNIIKDHFISINFTDMLQVQNIHVFFSLPLNL